MKRFFLILAVLYAIITGNALSQEMQKGSSVLNLGLGFVEGGLLDIGELGVGMNVAYDYGLIDTWGPGIFTIGGFVGFSTRSPHNIRYTNWGITPRATYRYPISSSFEVYGTAMVGLYLVTNSLDLVDTKYRHLVASTVGLRHWFGSNISIFTELGVFGSVLLFNGGLGFSF